MTAIGYARVSSKEESADSQLESLAAAGVAKTLVETAVGALANRPKRELLLDSVLRPGDVLVVTKLDRLGKTMRDLTELTARLESMSVGLRVLSPKIDTTNPDGQSFFLTLAAVAEFQHDLNVQSTKDGLQAARTRGKTGGRKPGMNPTQVSEARAMIEGGAPYTKKQIAARFNVSRATLYRHLAERTLP